MEDSTYSNLVVYANGSAEAAVLSAFEFYFPGSAYLNEPEKVGQDKVLLFVDYDGDWPISVVCGEVWHSKCNNISN